MSTTTGLQLARSIGRYGQRNSASVRVSSGAGTPRGTVRLSVSGVVYFLTLHNGRASHALPRYLAPRHTYTVRAKYFGQGCFKGSSASKQYTVVGRGPRSHVVTHARSIHRGSHPLVYGRVTKSYGGRAFGDVAVSLYFHGDLMKTRTVSLHDGHFRARFAKVYQVGRWTAVATKMNTGASDSASFRVRR